MIKEKIKILIQEALKNLKIEVVNFSVEHPEDLNNGDYSSNVALLCAKKLKANPKELAEKIIAEIAKEKLDEKIENIEVAGIGFINFYLSREFFTESTQKILKEKENWGSNNVLKGQNIMVEYTDPNPFKPFHIGHLMSNAIGESIARIFEKNGAHVIRANYQGDVGLHVAKAIYGMHKSGPPADESASPSVLAQYIGESYSNGSDAYDNDPEAKKEIDILNKQIYERSNEEVNKVYDWGRHITLQAFEDIYKILGTKFVHYFFESELAPIGQKIVAENMGKVFEQSDGAVVFRAEKYDPKLHTRVFITSQGLPMYETKELGLTVTKFQKENIDLSVVITAHEQSDYMKVVAKALSIIHPEYEKKMKHITHGMMRLESGKMSSRKGNVITGESLIRDTISLISEKLKERHWGEAEKKEVAEVVGVAAIKYSILRSQAGSDIIYDVEKSVSVEGDSGPYLQYALVRAHSVLEKAHEEGNIEENFNDTPEEITNLERLLYRFPEVVMHSYDELKPHHIATYLTELASIFNSFYAQTKIIDKDDKYSPYYLALTKAFYFTMQSGLTLLGIKIPERM